MIQESATGNVGFVIPKQAGAHYRHLFFEYVPALEKQLSRYEVLVPELETLAENRRQQADTLQSILVNRGEALEHCDQDKAGLNGLLNETNEARKREQRGKRFWRTTTLVLAGSTTVLGLLVAVK